MGELSLAGQEMGRLLVLEPIFEHAGRVQWLCRCECGGEVRATAKELRRGQVESCGCPDPRAAASAAAMAYLRGHPLRSRFYNMHQRCGNPRATAYASYGGRGIRVCPEWHDFAQYVVDIEALGPQPSPSHTIDRIDNDGNYEPGNVRWADKTTQIRNRRNVHDLTARIAELEAENERLRSLIPYDAQEAA